MTRPAPDLLFDTQAFIDYAKGELPDPVVRALRKERKIYYSPISPWELIIKKRFHTTGVTVERFWLLVETLGAVRLNVERPHIERMSTLPVIHRCPFDRMLIAQAMSERLLLVGGDRKFPLYPGLEFLWD
jgi:PIN domain nuclease of toxin-antitoxin system